jgi:hypothetical protein
MKWLRWIVGPCVFGHERRVYERAPDGSLLLVCPRCLSARPVRLVTG